MHALERAAPGRASGITVAADGAVGFVLAVDGMDRTAAARLQAEVEARHVAEAFVMLARAERTTGHVMTVDGGNIEAALR